MSRYIDAEWLLNFFEPYPDDYQTPLGSLRACVDDAPSIEIVFCEECKKSKIGYSNGEFYRWCFHNIKRVKDNDFCSDAKRRESHEIDRR